MLGYLTFTLDAIHLFRGWNYVNFIYLYFNPSSPRVLFTGHLYNKRANGWTKQRRRENNKQRKKMQALTYWEGLVEILRNKGSQSFHTLWLSFWGYFNANVLCIIVVFSNTVTLYEIRIVLFKIFSLLMFLCAC